MSEINYQVRDKHGNIMTDTLEKLTGKSGFLRAEIDDHGQINLNYSGETEVFWDDQKSVRRNGELVFLDEDGEKHEATDLFLVPEGSHVDEALDLGVPLVDIPGVIPYPVTKPAETDVQMPDEPEIGMRQVSDLMEKRIAGGDLSHEGIPDLLVRYGMMDPKDFVNEMRERKAMLDNGMNAEA